ncbi:hypothetical protein LINGRAHAP2_LOCUS34889 [Linum grandiflorum]
MVDLYNEIFLASFENPMDYDIALTGGPWMILDHYLMIVWIRFPWLPYQYYHGSVLKGLGNRVGRIACLDERTLTSAWGKFARLVVEINVHEPVSTLVILDDV